MNKCIIGLSAACMLILSASSFAQTASPPNAQVAQQNFAQHKQLHLTRISNHIAILQQEQSCVQAAANPQAIQACLQARRSAVQAMEQQFHGLN